MGILSNFLTSQADYMRYPCFFKTQLVGRHIEVLSLVDTSYASTMIISKGYSSVIQTPVLDGFRSGFKFWLWSDTHTHSIVDYPDTLDESERWL